MSRLDDAVLEMETNAPQFVKTYRAIRGLFEELFGEGFWEKIPVPEGVGSRGAKAEKLPFGSEMVLSARERHRYKTAKQILAVLAGLPVSGWGLYGRTIRARVKELLEDKDKRKRIQRKVKKIKQQLKQRGEKAA